MTYDMAPEEYAALERLSDNDYREWVAAGKPDLREPENDPAHGFYSVPRACGCGDSHSSRKVWWSQRWTHYSAFLRGETGTL